MYIHNVLIYNVKYMYLLQWPVSPHVKAKIRSFQAQLKFEARILNQKQLDGEVKTDQRPTKNIENHIASGYQT